jgi:hypothetical protein
MFVFVFDGALFQFDVREPEFEPFVQLPPRYAGRFFPRSTPTPQRR